VHHIQQKILNKLLYAENLTYAAMRPTGIESNHFAYHLDQLVKDRLVTKQDRHYTLATAGLALVDRLSQEKMVDRLQPHIVTAIHITNEAGQTLLFKRGFQPFIHRYGFIKGKIHYEETIHQAAIRELQEKTGMQDVALTHRGVVYLESKIRGITISKVLYHLFQGHVHETSELTSSHRGSSAWIDIASLDAHELVPGYLAIRRLLDTNTDFFFAELSDEQAEKPITV